jgi:hypothetical protein
MPTFWAGLVRGKKPASQPAIKARAVQGRGHVFIGELVVLSD